MKYKNTSDRILKFRAHDKKGIVKVFELKPGKEMESDREVGVGGLEKISEKEGKGKLTKKTKGDD
ncbi:hypothetical protein LCGC14_1554140 [marine sediment metagenome]|uniref:Uncharacterized protein n=1 Tax=marine sediment metagenome TaxID=412755 RepID=A0A0F9IPG2_9ZZZZ